MDNSNNIRVRFAPSPSGFLHIGGARTALFNYLFAKKRGGKFIVRIDDTDLSRSSDDSIKSILNDLKWLGLDWDHGIDSNTFLDMDSDGPYRASNRRDIYKHYADLLIASGHAYVDKVDDSHVIKFKVDTAKDILFFDDIRGKLTSPAGVIHDFVIIRSNGMATYNFATVIDDYLMKISHVYRADEHIINTYKQVLIFNAFNWTLPKFGHMALIFGQDKTKLSKRHGAASIDDFRRKGYTKDALINYIAMLGWGHPKGKDIFSMDDLIDVFSIKKINLSPAIFDTDKLNFINAHYLNKMDKGDLANMIKDLLSDMHLDLNLINKAVPIFMNYWKNGVDIRSDFNKILGTDIDDDSKNFIKSSSHSRDIINYLISRDYDFSKALLLDVPKKDLMWTLRILLIGTPHGPSVDLLKDVVSVDGVKKRVDSLMGA